LAADEEIPATSSPLRGEEKEAPIDHSRKILSLMDLAPASRAARSESEDGAIEGNQGEKYKNEPV
jgi:hypothetical protein